MYEDKFDMTERERKHCDEILARFQADGKLWAHNRVEDDYKFNGAGQKIAIDYQVVLGKNFIVDHHGLVWRFHAKNSPKMPHRPDGGGTPWRKDVVEIWTGKWRQVPGEADGDKRRPRYAKHIICIPLSANVNKHPGISHIDWYMQTKGFKHPFDSPADPDDFQISVMERTSLQVEPVIWAQMSQKLEEEGIEAADRKAIIDTEQKKRWKQGVPPQGVPVAPPKPNRKRRTNRTPKAEAAVAS